MKRLLRSCLLGTAWPALATFWLTGCLVGPDYQRPAALGTNAVPPTFSTAPEATNIAGWKPAEPSAHLPRTAWWELFKDPELNRLEALATADNQDLVAAVARFQQASAVVHVARADLFPQVSFDPSYIRQRTSVNQAQLGKPAGASYTYSTWTIPLDASWELDLWGRVRRQVEAARAQLAASADDLQSVTLAIQAELAVDYFGLRFAQSDDDILQRSVQTYGRSLELTRNRRVGGIATDLDVAQAETQLRATEAEIPAVELQISRFNHALAALCGQAATEFKVSVPAPSAPVEIPDVPMSLPSELLERRPDIAAAERRMAAANAQIGVAQTAFYPRVRLNGAAGLQSVSASTLFDWPSRFWAVGPTIDLPLFTGGRNRAQLAVARAAYDEGVAQYRQTVLGAFQEVEDQLSAGRYLSAQITGEVAALAASRRTLEIANNRYRAGLVTYLEVAIAQGDALNRERTVVQLQAQRLAASAGLIRALGGGWSSGPAGNGG
jgi:NodT family efflux transporter outer membrane factor (OMF) lipoprotein